MFVPVDCCPSLVFRGEECGLHAGGVRLHLPSAGPQALGDQTRRVALSLPGKRTMLSHFGCSCGSGERTDLDFLSCPDRLPLSFLSLSDAVLLAHAAVACGGHRLR